MYAQASKCWPDAVRLLRQPSLGSCALAIMNLTFGPFRVNPGKRLLLRSNQPVSLTGKAYEILLMLLERSGQVVPKSELIERVSDSVPVGESQLRVYISKLRKALDDGGKGLRYIENVNGHGYRFIAPVTRTEQHSQPPAEGRGTSSSFLRSVPPPLSGIVGREGALERLIARLLEKRLVTLVGPGGIGKTTLAIAACHRLQGAAFRAVHFIDLSSLQDPALVPASIESVLGVPLDSGDGLASIGGSLNHGRTLLLLDSCERVISAVAPVAEALRVHAPQLHILATSREPLRAEGEAVLRLPPLDLPVDSAPLSVAEARSFSAVDLFVRRATESACSFELTDADVGAVVDICRKLDGMPLAIELAAVRAGTYSVREVAANLDNRLAFLTQGHRTAPSRHQSLRATLDWSYETLLEDRGETRSGGRKPGDQTSARGAAARMIAGASFEFGPFELIPDRRLLLRAGGPVNVPSRAWEILLALIERAGELVGKADLLARVWPRAVVEEGALRVHISGLRRILGDRRGGLRYIESVTSLGYRFVAAVRRRDREEALVPTRSPPCNAQPPMPRHMIGRDDELSTLLMRLSRRRLLTITGPGGVGKSTLAMAAMDRLAVDLFSQACFVDLGSVRDPALVHASLACQLGLSVDHADPLSNIADLIQQRRMLIVLDNCEQVIECAAHTVERLLALLPGLRILTTSREPLRSRGECVLRLAPLQLPPLSIGSSVAKALTFAAVQLFVRRAGESCDGFQLSDADVPAAVDICRNLDGLPLAIELAASRMDILNPQLLAACLEDGLRLLTRGHRTALPRHQTLRATLDWSYDTLSAAERKAFRGLAAFAGNFDTDSAIAVVGDVEMGRTKVMNILGSLVAKSLLAVSDKGPKVLFHLLHTARAYALEKLGNSGESDIIHRKYTELHTTWAQASTKARCGRGHRSWQEPPSVGADSFAVFYSQSEAHHELSHFYESRKSPFDTDVRGSPNQRQSGVRREPRRRRSDAGQGSSRWHRRRDAQYH